jgi:uncharacterized protein YdhG (YjbR/CyaY superfamily)
MASSAARTVDQYLKELSAERREVVSTVREVIRKNLPKGYQETMNWGMISYEVPLDRFPKTYNGQPLMYAALAAQKNHFAVYLISMYQDGAPTGWFAEEFRKAGKKLDMGKSCVRFKKLADLPLETIGKAIRGTSPEKLIEIYEASRGKK